MIMIASSAHQAWLFYSPLARQAARLKHDLLAPHSGSAPIAQTPVA